MQKLGDMQETMVLDGDFEFKVGQQDYYLSKQKRVFISTVTILSQLLLLCPDDGSLAASASTPLFPSFYHANRVQVAGLGGEIIIGH
jgi:hypothetical protein